MSEKSLQEVMNDLRAIANVYGDAIVEFGKIIAAVAKPVSDFLEGAARVLNMLRESIRPLIAQLKTNRIEAERLRQIAVEIEAHGWFPWIGAPFPEFSNSTDPAAAYEAWLNQNWSTTADFIRETVGHSDLGRSPTNSLELALYAHENELYEQVPRILFPEIEKCAGLFFYPSPAPKGETQLGSIRQTLETIWEGYGTFLSNLDPSIAPLAQQMVAIGKYVYESKWDKLSEDPLSPFFPNRNRVLHGIRSDEYNSRKASINSIFIYAAMIQGVAFVKMEGISSQTLASLKNTPR